jgi:hypothetical protein
MILYYLKFAAKKGNAHDVIAGIGLVNMLWHGLDSQESVPIDYRIYDKDTNGKTKNTHFCDMLKLARARGITPSAVVMDAWYSSLDNLKAIRSHGWIWVTTLRKNRIVNRNVPLETLEIPEEGLSIHLRGYGWVFVFKILPLQLGLINISYVLHKKLRFINKIGM